MCWLPASLSARQQRPSALLAVPLIAQRLFGETLPLPIKLEPPQSWGREQPYFGHLLGRVVAVEPFAVLYVRRAPVSVLCAVVRTILEPPHKPHMHHPLSLCCKLTLSKVSYVEHFRSIE